MKETFINLYDNPLFLIVLTLFLGIATYTDIKTMKIPNKLNGIFFVVRLLLIPVIGFAVSDVLGALFTFIVLIIPAIIKMHKMGGDIKCLTVVGLYVGIYLAPLFLVMTIIYFWLYAGICLLFKKKLKNIPFAPFFFASHITLLIIHIFWF